jgi:hypothetical protein
MLGMAGPGMAWRGNTIPPHSFECGSFLTMSEDSGELRRLPLWKSCLDEMLKAGVSYGQTYDAEYFETRLSAVRDTLPFNAAIHCIREGLEHHGFYLSGRGFNASGFSILPVEQNLDASKMHQRAGLKFLRRTVTLLMATPGNLLAEEKRKNLERFLEKASLRLALVQRPRSFFDLQKKSKPKQLTEAP